jgi:hypothetical protein
MLYTDIRSPVCLLMLEEGGNTLMVGTYFSTLNEAIAIQRNIGYYGDTGIDAQQARNRSTTVSAERAER